MRALWAASRTKSDYKFIINQDAECANSVRIPVSSFIQRYKKLERTAWKKPVSDKTTGVDGTTHDKHMNARLNVTECNVSETDSSNSEWNEIVVMVTTGTLMASHIKKSIRTSLDLRVLRRLSHIIRS